MVKSLFNRFHFRRLRRPGRTHLIRHRKPMTKPVASTEQNIELCEKLITELAEAEAEVLNSLENPETAWPFLTELRQLKRQTQQDLASLAPNNPLVIDQAIDDSSAPVRTVKTRTGLHWLVFNGGQAR